MYGLLFLLVPFADAPGDLLARLDSPTHRVRQAADAELRHGLTYPRALWLEAVLPRLPAEVRYRVRHALHDYWRVGLPDLDAMPHIDSMTNPLNDGCRDILTRGYLNRAATLTGVRPANTSLETYRVATALMVEDLLAQHAPPQAVRRLLWVMGERTRAWEIRQRVGPWVEKIPTWNHF